MTPRSSLFHLAPLELPRREAADVDVKRVEPGSAPVAGELDLKLHLVVSDWPLAHGAVDADARTAPCAIRATGGELSALNRRSGQDSLFVISGLLAQRPMVGRRRTRQNLIMTSAKCAACGKSVEPSASRFEVREGEKLFHFDCYRLYKRQPPPLLHRPKSN